MEMICVDFVQECFAQTYIKLFFLLQLVVYATHAKEHFPDQFSSKLKSIRSAWSSKSSVSGLQTILARAQNSLLWIKLWNIERKTQAKPVLLETFTIG